MELKDLIGAHVFSGIETGAKEFRSRYWGRHNGNYVKFTLDNITYIAVEDPSDGYRSYMGTLLQIDEPCKIKIPDVPVVCHMKDESNYDVLVFRDALSGRVVLELGTCYTDSYYPYCVMEYHPENMACNSGTYRPHKK